jgi:hypothetical protein
MADLTEFIIFETNTVVESCDVTFDETTSCPHGVLECAGDKEIEESIFVGEGLHGVDGDEDESLLPSTSSPEPVPASTLEAEASQATTLSHPVFRPKLNAFLYVCQDQVSHIKRQMVE